MSRIATWSYLISLLVVPAVLLAQVDTGTLCKRRPVRKKGASTYADRDQV
jgi:hypothetical protein